jgi:hypothetical protein
MGPEPLPSQAAKAYEAILPSVVRVIGLMEDNDTGENNPEQRAMERQLGTGAPPVEAPKEPMKQLPVTPHVESKPPQANPTKPTPPTKPAVDRKR